MTAVAAPTGPAGGGLATVAATTPYPWPWDGGCPGARLALVAAGWDEGWRGRAVDPGTVEPLVTALAVAVAAAGGAVVAVAHGAPCRPGPPAAVPDGPVPRPLAGAVAHRAAGVDGFWGGGLDADLRARGVTHLLVAGHGLEGPVHSTLRSANDRGYECLLVRDASSPLVAGLAAPSRSMVEMSGGIFGAVGAGADVLAALTPVPDPPPPARSPR